jgi:Protein of unknown function (DUF4239)
VSSMAITCIAFAWVFGGALLGMLLRAALPEHHVSTEAKDLVKLGMGLIATMAALVLGLMVASARSSYDRQSTEITQMSANISLLDRILARYGPETKEARDLLRRSVVRIVDLTWPENGSRPPELKPTAAGAEGLYEDIQELSPQNEVQRSLQAHALRMSLDLAQTRWLLHSQRGGSAVAIPFLVVLVFWLTIIFLGFGLVAPRNATAVAALFVSALSVSSAIFLILALDRPFEGLLRISSAPLRNTLAYLGQ